MCKWQNIILILGNPLKISGKRDPNLGCNPVFKNCEITYFRCNIVWIFHVFCVFYHLTVDIPNQFH